MPGLEQPTQLQEPEQSEHVESITTINASANERTHAEIEKKEKTALKYEQKQVLVQLVKSNQLGYDRRTNTTRRITPTSVNPLAITESQLEVITPYSRADAARATLEGLPSQSGPELLANISGNAFVPEYELLHLVIAMGEVKGDTRAEQVSSRRAMVEEYERQLNAQRLEIAATIEQLYTAVAANPDIEEDALKELVERHRKAGRFSHDQMQKFAEGIKAFRQKRTNLILFDQKFPDPMEKYKALYGKYPEGKVEWEKGPMTLMAVCYNQDDYAYIFEFGRTKGDQQKFNSVKDKSQARLSGGCATSVSLQDQMSGIITAENVTSNSFEFEYAKGKEPKIRRLEVGKDALGDIDHRFLLEYDRVDIRTLDKTTYTVTTNPEETDYGQARHIRVIRTNADGDEVESWEASSLTDASRYGPRPLIYIELESEAHTVGFLTVYPNYVSIVVGATGEHLDEPLVVAETVAVRVPIRNIKASKPLIIHEDQHQFNKLFTPQAEGIADQTLDKNMTRDIIAQELARTDSIDKEKLRQILVRVAKLSRRSTGVDNSARDEILAFATDGRNVQDIISILSTNPLYDYRGNNDAVFQRAIQDYYGYIHEGIMRLEYDHNNDAKDTPKKATLLEISPEQLTPFFEQAWGPDYHGDLKRWAGCITKLEAKGYSRQEAVRFLYQERIEHWNSMANALPPKAPKI